MLALLVFLAGTVVLEACNNSGSVDVNVLTQATHTPTETPLAASTDTPAPGTTPTATPTPTPTPEQGGALADLLPLRVDVSVAMPPAGCVNDIDEVMVSVEVCVLNQGSAAAGPFEAELRVAGAVTVDFPGAAAGAEVCESAPLLTGQFVFDVDPAGAVAESDESNNAATFAVDPPTLPPICPTPSA